MLWQGVGVGKLKASQLQEGKPREKGRLPRELSLPPTHAGTQTHPPQGCICLLNQNLSSGLSVPLARPTNLPNRAAFPSGSPACVSVVRVLARVMWLSAGTYLQNKKPLSNGPRYVSKKKNSYSTACFILKTPINPNVRKF